MIKYAFGFLFSKDKEKVVLIKKTKPEWQAGFLNGEGGKVEQGETYVEAMIFWHNILLRVYLYYLLLRNSCTCNIDPGVPMSCQNPDSTSLCIVCIFT